MTYAPADRVTAHFRLRELDPEDALRLREGGHRVARHLLQQLEVIRAATGARPMTITRRGGYQPPDDIAQLDWPAERSDGSRHRGRAGEGASVCDGEQLPFSLAADIVNGMPPLELANLIVDLAIAGEISIGGVGCYHYGPDPRSARGFVHVDTRSSGDARWAYPSSGPVVVYQPSGTRGRIHRRFRWRGRQ